MGSTRRSVHIPDSWEATHWFRPHPCNSLSLCLCFCYSLPGPDCTQLNALLKAWLKRFQDISLLYSQTQEILPWKNSHIAVCVSFFLQFDISCFILIACFLCCFLSSVGKCLWFTHPVFLTITCPQRLLNEYFLNDVCIFLLVSGDHKLVERVMWASVMDAPINTF